MQKKQITKKRARRDRNYPEAPTDSLGKLSAIEGDLFFPIGELLETLSDLGVVASRQAATDKVWECYVFRSRVKSASKIAKAAYWLGHHVATRKSLNTSFDLEFSKLKGLKNSAEQRSAAARRASDELRKPWAKFIGEGGKTIKEFQRWLGDKNERSYPTLHRYISGLENEIKDRAAERGFSRLPAEQKVAQIVHDMKGRPGITADVVRHALRKTQAMKK